ncbi:MAG: hypothetical protein ACRDJ0_05375 [Actinomycetota bacterium]
MSEPPKTWDELMEMAREVQDKTGTKYGFIFQGAEYEGGVVNGLEFVYNAGAEVFPEDDPAEVVLDQGGADKGLAMQQRLVEEGIPPGGCDLQGARIADRLHPGRRRVHAQLAVRLRNGSRGQGDGFRDQAGPGGHRSHSHARGGR